MSKPKPNYIYGLVDPFTHEIRYIGKSEVPKTRYKNHLKDESITHRTNWIRSVLSQGSKPKLVILQKLDPSEDWQKAERKWIKFGKKMKWPLTNCTDGGDGVNGLPPEIRQRMAQTWTGRKHKPESIIKIGLASKGRKHTEENKQKMKEIMTGRFNNWGQKVSRTMLRKRYTKEQFLDIKEMLRKGREEKRKFVIKDVCLKYGMQKGIVRKFELGEYDHAFLEKDEIIPRTWEDSGRFVFDLEFTNDSYRIYGGK